MGTLPRRAGLAEPAPPTPRGMAPGAGDAAARVARATAPARWPAPGLWVAAGPAVQRGRVPAERPPAACRLPQSAPGRRARRGVSPAARAPPRAPAPVG